MALNFPASPANGDNYTYNGRTWRYNGTTWLAIGDPSLGGEYVPAGGDTGQVLAKASSTDYDTIWADQSGGVVGTSVTVSETPPSSPSSGDLWWDSNSNILYIWYVGVDSGQWLTAGGIIGPTSSVDSTIVRFDGTTGKLVKASGITIDDSNNLLIGLSSVPSGWTNYGVLAVNGTNGGGVLFGAEGTEKGYVYTTLDGYLDIYGQSGVNIGGAILSNGYTEQVYTATGTTPALSPSNGSIQTWTLSGNSTPTAGTWADGQSITLMVDDGSASTITWTTLAVVWKTNGGSAPTLNTDGFTVIALWKVGTTIYGARVGDA
jgi:hypothetical protein